MLANLVGITVAGFQADRRGPAPVLAVGLVLFGSGLTIAGLAPAMIVLVGARVVQGVGAGAMSAAVYVGVARGFSEDIRPRMFAVLSTAWVVPGLIGPAIAGSVADAATWRVVFVGLLPLVIVGGALALPALAGMTAAEDAAPHDPGGDASGLGRASKAPVFDALRLAIGTAVVLGGLSARSLPVAVILFGLGGVVAVPPLRRLLPPGTLSGAVGMPSAVATLGLLSFLFFGADAYVPLAIESGGRSATAGGLALTAGTLCWAAGTWIQERSQRRWARRSSVRTGLALILLGVATEAVAVHGGLVLAVPVAGWGVAGLGMGLAFQSLTLEVLNDAPRRREGEATAALQLANVLGVALGAGTGGAAVALGQHQGWAAGSGITVAFAVAFGGGLAAMIAAHRLPRGVDGRGPRPMNQAGEQLTLPKPCPGS